MVVAIDGPAGAGKSTVAGSIARRTHFLYINSGNFYRAITLAALHEGADPADQAAVLEIARRTAVEIVDGRIHLSGKDVEKDLHTDRVDRWVAEHSAIPEVRAIVNSRLREAVRELDVIVEGRDIGTAVFPDAAVKVYLDASIRMRANRRFGQGTSTLSLAEIEENIRKRDEIDKNKPIGSLKIADDALYIDSSDLTIDEVCERVIRKIRTLRSLSSRSRFT